MCDAPRGPLGLQWKGWPSWPPTLPSVGDGEWIDLSYPLNGDVPRVPMFPKPSFCRWKGMPEHPYNVTEMNMIVHMGTHVDAPRHFICDGPTSDQIPLDRLMGDGVVWHFETPEYGVIGPPDLERQRPRMAPGDMVFIETGWAAHAGTDIYDRHPSLSEDAAQWLIDHRAKLVGIDFGTPEAPVPRRWPGWHWPVHTKLLGNGVLIAEHLRGLDALAGQRVEAMMLCLNIVGSDGAPVRAVARRSTAAFRRTAPA
jgi:kynurenine formamidase